MSNSKRDAAIRTLGEWYIEAELSSAVDDESITQVEADNFKITNEMSDHMFELLKSLLIEGDWGDVLDDICDEAKKQIAIQIASSIKVEKKLKKMPKEKKCIECGTTIAIKFYPKADRIDPRWVGFRGGYLCDDCKYNIESDSEEDFVDL